jgi:hypothetical protein
MIEDNQLVAFSTFGGDIPAFEGSAVVRRNIDIFPTSHSIVIGRLKDKAAQRFDDASNGFDLLMVFFGNGLELLQGPFHSLIGYSSHDLRTAPQGSKKGFVSAQTSTLGRSDA